MSFAFRCVVTTIYEAAGGWSGLLRLAGAWLDAAIVFFALLGTTLADATSGLRT
jgi:hypothetical protein